MTFLDVAVLGTARQSSSGVPQTGTPVDALVEALGPVGNEAALLLKAGALAVYRMAGHQALTAIQGPPRAPDDQLPEPSAAGARLLRELIERGDAGLLCEALPRLRSGGCRVPTSQLPAALDLNGAGVRDALAPVLGERGRWLAQFRSDWRWAIESTTTDAASSAEAERVWQEGSVEARGVALRAARNADPERARAWIEAVWAEEKSERRADWLRVLSIRLAPADEQLLERALDDRSQVVRAVAAELLARLPESDLARRIADRADGLLSYRAATGAWARVKSKVTGAPPGELDAKPPPSLEASWERDGIPARPPKGIGERAHWLAALLALVPPGHWEERFSASAADLVPAAWAGEWGFAVTLGWSRAALLFAERGWMAPLWDRWLHTRLDGAEAVVQREILRLLLQGMERASAEARVVDVMRDPPSGDLLGAGEAVALLAGPWGDVLARTYLDILEDQVRAKEPALEFLRQTGPHAALAIPPDCFARAMKLVQLAEPAGGGSSPWKKPLEAFTDVVQLRRRIHEELPT